MLSTVCSRCSLALSRSPNRRNQTLRPGNLRTTRGRRSHQTPLKQAWENHRKTLQHPEETSVVYGPNSPSEQVCAETSGQAPGQTGLARRRREEPGASPLRRSARRGGSDGPRRAATGAPRRLPQGPSPKGEADAVPRAALRRVSALRH